MKNAAVVAALVASGQAMPGAQTYGPVDPSTYGPVDVNGVSPDTYAYDNGNNGVSNGGIPDPYAYDNGNNGVSNGAYDPYSYDTTVSGAGTGNGDWDDDSDDDVNGTDSAPVIDYCVDVYPAGDIWSCADYSDLVPEVCVPIYSTETVTVTEGDAATITETVDTTVTETCPAATVTEDKPIDVDCGIDTVTETLTCPESTSTICVDETITPTFTAVKYDYTIQYIHPQIVETTTEVVAPEDVTETVYGVEITVKETPTVTDYNPVEVCITPTVTETEWYGVETETITNTVYAEPVTEVVYNTIIVPLGCVIDDKFCDTYGPVDVSPVDSYNGVAPVYDGTAPVDYGNGTGAGDVPVYDGTAPVVDYGNGTGAGDVPVYDATSPVDYGYGNGNGNGNGDITY